VPRKTRLTPQLRDEIVRHVRDGNFIEPSARACGVSHSTLYLWLQLGRAGRKPYVDFVDLLEQAEAEAEIAVVAHVRSAIPSTWRAGFRWLESRTGRWRLRDVSPQLQVVMNQSVGTDADNRADSLSAYLRRNPHRIEAVLGALRVLAEQMRPETRAHRGGEPHDDGASDQLVSGSA
jgi:hypothetical protein